MSRPDDWKISLERITKDLENRTQATQESAAHELIKLVETQERELQGLQLSVFVSDLNKSIAKLVKSNDSVHTYGASFLDMPFEGISIGRLIMHLADYIQIGIESTEVNVVKLSAKAIGKLSKIASGGRDTVGTAISEMVNNQIVKACDTWADPTRFHEARRYAAILILAQVALNSPTLFFIQLNRFFKVIWTAVSDPSIEIRSKACKAISHCLQFVQGRSNDKDYQLRFWLEIRKEFLEGGQKEREPHFIHGYLVTLGHLLTHASTFMKSAAEAVTIVFNNKDHKDRLVKSTVITLLPKLANVNSVEFVKKRHLENAMDYLTSSLKKSGLDLKDKATIFLSIGDIAQAVKNCDEFTQYIRPVMNEVTQVILQSNKMGTSSGLGLQSIQSTVLHTTHTKGRSKDKHRDREMKRRSVENMKFTTFQPINESLICVRNLVGAFPGTFQTEYKSNECLELLDIMIATGLREELINTLEVIGDALPDIRKEIWQRVKKMLKTVVSETQTHRVELAKNKKLTSDFDNDLILALNTLATFSHGDLTEDFQKNIIVQFLDNDNVAIRAQASSSIAKLLLRTEQSLGDATRSPSQTASTMATLEKLLITGISDPDLNIRETVFEELQSMHTVPFLSQCLADPYTIHSLLLGLNDEVFRIRELVCVTIGKIIIINPTLVIPLLRKAVIQLLNEVKFGNAKTQELGIVLITALVVSCKQYIAAYTSSIIPLFLEKLRAHEQAVQLQASGNNGQTTNIVVTNIRVATNALIGMGELSVYVKKDILIYFDELLVIILRYLKDHTSVERRIVGLRALGLLVGSSGFVIDPYFKYPDLLDILLEMIKNETKKELRRELIKVIGVLGAIDPYAHKTESEKRKLQQMQEMLDENGTETSVDRYDPSPDYYNIVAVKVLIKILKSQSSSNYHDMALRALVKVMQQFQVVDDKKFVGTLMSSLCQSVLHSERPGLLLSYIATIIGIIKGADHALYIQQIFELINLNWHTNAFPDALLILEELSRSTSVDILKAYLHQIVPKIISLLNIDHSEDKQKTLALLHTIGVIAPSFDEFSHLITPPIVSLIENIENSITIRIAAMQTLGMLCSVLNFSETALQIIHPINRILLQPGHDLLKNMSLRILCHLIFHIGTEYSIFIPVIRRAIANQPTLDTAVYDKFVDILFKNNLLLLKKTDLPSISFAGTEKKETTTTTKTTTTSTITNTTNTSTQQPKKSGISLEGGNAELQFNSSYINSLLKVNEALLRQSCKARSQSTKEDWFEWYRRFSIEIIRQSPDSSIRHVVEIAQENQSLVKELFLPAFISCWNNISELARDDISDNLSIAFRSATLPSELLHLLLNLYEYIDHAKQCKVAKLNVDIELKELSSKAENCHAYAKALHYKENEFQSAPTSEIVGNLISLNNQLHQPHAAEGVLVIAEKFHIHLKESWYEKLHRWSDALRVYETREMSQYTDKNATPLSPIEKLELLHGKIRCYHELSEWRRVLSGSKKLWKRCGTVFSQNERERDEFRQKFAVMGAKAAWHVEDWNQLEIFCRAIKDDPVSFNFFCALKALHDGNFNEVRSYVQQTRDRIDGTLTALVSESYIRAYDEIVKLQQLAEIEEIINYKEAKLDSDERKHILNVWEKRLKGCQPSTKTWEKILAVRSLAIKQEANLGSWLQYGAIAQKSGQLRLSHRVLTKLLGCDPAMQPLAPLPVNQPIVTFSYLKQIWASGSYQMAIEGIINFRKFLSRSSPETDKHLLMRVNLSLGKWLYQFNEDKLNETHLPQILDCYTKAMEYNHPPDYKAWKAWAQVNFDLVQYYEHIIKRRKKDGLVPDLKQKGKDQKDNIKERRLQHVVSSVKGFFVAQNLSPTKFNGELRYALRLLKLLFKYGNENEVYTAFRTGYTTSSVDTWLQVIPQIIARMDIPKKMVRRLIYDLLLLVGKEHPQSLVYPLSVSVQSQPVTNRGKGGKVLSPAHQIMNKMREHSQVLLDQVVLVSQELIRVAITWAEEWYNTLEDAYGCFFDDGNIEAFLNTIQPQHDKLNFGSTTLLETAFHQSFSRDLKEAEKCCQKYRSDGNVMHLNQAWVHYLHVFKQIEQQRLNLKVIEIKYASHQLENASNLILAVPGTYSKDTKVTTIAKFLPTLQIIMSKQRPRKMGIISDQGKVYHFLLKGREDLRQDERVMQLFGLVNNLLQNDRATAGLHVLVKRFSVIPLSPTTGLIGWVPNCDTLNEIINEYRSSQSPPILPKVELKVIDYLSNNNYYSMKPIQRQEIFNALMKKFDGNDLKSMLWLKSPDSEAWLERRTNYTRTLALMSMIGYILGLGDRHPNNIMIEKHTGHVVHIDFGDCFEVAMKRSISPEKIPFRLTRMLINSMEVSGIEGSFRTTCEAVMGCLRNNKDSLMAVLEAFVHDPLINWRLVENEIETDESKVINKDLSAASMPDDGHRDKPSYLINLKLGKAEENNHNGSLPNALQRKNTVINNAFQRRDSVAKLISSNQTNNENLLEVMQQQKSGGVVDNHDEIDYGHKPAKELLNEQALSIVHRVKEKLTGQDFNTEQTLSVEHQVSRLIEQAMLTRNLCQGYFQV